MSALIKLAAPATASALALAGWMLQIPHDPTAGADEAAAGLDFERRALPSTESNQRMRPVAPDLEPIQRWISAVGASVAAVDLRGQGHAGDACLTDPRDDRVRIFSVPGSTGVPFETFELEPDGLRYDLTMAPIGCVAADINTDGFQDFLVYYWGRSPVMFLNGGPGSDGRPGPDDFRPTELVTPMQVWNSTALNVADIDGDGALDVMVGNYFPDGARVLDPEAEHDPRMQMQHSMGKARNAGHNKLFLSVGDRGGVPTFEDQSEQIPNESARSWTLAIGFQDLTDNGLPDAYVANDFGPDQLLVNTSVPGEVELTVARADRNLTTPRSRVLGHDSFKGMGVEFTYDAKMTLPRILVSNITSPWGLQESNFAFEPSGSASDLLRGDVPYSDKSTDWGLAHSGWSWDIKAVDLRNSGVDDLIQATGFISGTEDQWPRLQETAMGNDLILEHPEAWLRLDEKSDISGHESNRLWLRSGSRYVEAGAAVPFDDSEVTRGIAPADVNGDGLYDFLVANQWGDSFVYINRSDPEGDALTLNVVRRNQNDRTTPLVGAVVELRNADGYYRKAQLYPGNGHSGVTDAALHFGIPEKVAGPFEASIRWMEGGTVQTYTDVVEIGTQEVVVK